MRTPESPVQPGTVSRSPVCWRNKQVQPSRQRSDYSTTAQSRRWKRELVSLPRNHRGSPPKSPLSGLYFLRFWVPQGPLSILFLAATEKGPATCMGRGGGVRGWGGVMLALSLSLSPPACFTAALLTLLVPGTLHTLKSYGEPRGVRLRGPCLPRVTVVEIIRNFTIFVNSPKVYITKHHSHKKVLRKILVSKTKRNF